MRILLLALSTLSAMPLHAQTGWQEVRRHSGAGFEEHFGRAVTSLQDVNGDGHSDYAIGAPGYDPGSARNTGAVHVFSGLDGVLLWSAFGAHQSSWFGNSLSSIPDLNGDQVMDLLVGASGGIGTVSIFSGTTGQVLGVLTGESSNDDFGASVASTGDLNGDGSPEILVGAPKWDLGPNRPDAGAVYVFSGSTGKRLHRFNGFFKNGWFGSKVSGPGDVDGDGVDDIAVGVPQTSNSGKGSVYLISGKSGVLLWSAQGSNFQAHLGESIAGLEDRTGDGLPDLLVASPDYYCGTGGTGSGKVTLFEGSTGRQVWSRGPCAESSLGQSVADLGDVDGDLSPEFAVGAPGETRASGRRGVALVIGAGNEWIIETPVISSVSGLGGSLASAGDINGDSFPDLITGAPYLWASSIQEAGIVFLYSYVIDNDEDGLSDNDERILGTDPFDQDSDDDGLSDGEEHLALGTDPLLLDTDADAVQDGTELSRVQGWPGIPSMGVSGTDPLVFIPDSDPATATDPHLPDTDGGGMTDGAEDPNGNGRIDAGERDPNNPLDDGFFLVVTPLLQGSNATLTTHSDFIGGTTHFLYSLTGTGPTTLSNGLVIDLSQPIWRIGIVPSNSSGVALFSFTVPPNTSGTTAYFQGIEAGPTSPRISNLVIEVVQ